MKRKPVFSQAVIRHVKWVINQTKSTRFFRPQSTRCAGAAISYTRPMHELLMHCFHNLLTLNSGRWRISLWSRAVKWMQPDTHTGRVKGLIGSWDTEKLLEMNNDNYITTSPEYETITQITFFISFYCFSSSLTNHCIILTVEQTGLKSTSQCNKEQSSG